MKKEMLVILIACCIFFGGCVENFQHLVEKLPGLPKGGKISVSGGDVDFYILFPKNREKINKEYEFRPAVRIENTGDIDTEGTLCIFGLDGETFYGFRDCECVPFEISTNPNSPNYREETIEFGPFSISPDASGAYTLTFSARYSYKTTGEFKPCIKKELNGPECRQEGNLLKTSSKAPIEIVQITETLMPEKNFADVVFHIKLKKSKDGNILGLESFREYGCILQEYEEEVEVILKDVPDYGEFYCGRAVFKDGEAEVDCNMKFNLFDESGAYLYKNYQPKIKIEVSYSFEKIKSSTFTVY